MRPVALAAAGATAAAVRAIAAVSRDGVIGVRGKLPWRLPREWGECSNHLLVSIMHGSVCDNHLVSMRQPTSGARPVALILGRKGHEDNGKGM